MIQIAKIPQWTTKCAGDWYVYRDDNYVYVQMAAGFGAKKSIQHNTTNVKCEYIARELTDHSERIATAAVNNSTEWSWWDYYSDHEFTKLGCKKAPVT
jgi:hypothetical protein